MGLALVADQLLLPMFHVGGVPYKLSYLLCGLWLVDRLARRDVDAVRAREFNQFALAMGLILTCALLGELWLASVYPVSDYGQTIRSTLIYMLVVLAFGFGLSASEFRASWLVPILFAALALNFAFIFLKAAMPARIVDIYYSSQSVDQLAAFGVTDVQSLLEMARPRGLFGNSNVSAHMVTIIVLFIHLALRHRLMRLPGPLVGFGIVALPIALTILLASRGEFLVACVLGLLNYRLIFARSRGGARVALVVLAVLAPVGGAIGLMRVIDADSLQNSVQRAVSVLDVVSKSSSESADEDSLSGVSRPLLTLQRMFDRFKFSPIFGSGFSATVGPPFAEGTEFFHNDWFRVIATSGLIGLFTMLWIIRRFCWPLGWPALIPFVLPALVNTFMLAIPTFMFYFFMTSVLREQIRRQTQSVG